MERQCGAYGIYPVPVGNVSYALLVVASVQSIAAHIQFHLGDEALFCNDLGLLIQQRPGTKSMVGVEVRKDHGMHGLAADFLQRFGQAWPSRCIATVDQHQSFIRFEDHHIDNGKAQQPSARRNRFDLELGTGIVNSSLVRATVQTIGHCIRQLGPETSTLLDGLDHLWVGFEDLCIRCCLGGVLRAGATSLISLMGEDCAGA